MYPPPSKEAHEAARKALASMGKKATSAHLPTETQDGHGAFAGATWLEEARERSLFAIQAMSEAEQKIWEAGQAIQQAKFNMSIVHGLIYHFEKDASSNGRDQ